MSNNKFNKDLFDIFNKSSPKSIFEDLVAYYENSLDTIDLNKLYSAYSKDKKINLVYKYTKPFFAVIVDNLRKRVKPKVLNIEYNALKSILSKEKQITKNKNSLLLGELQKYRTYMSKGLLYTKRENRVYRVKSYKVINHKITFDLESLEERTELTQYRKYINDLIAFDKSEINECDISKPFLNFDMKEYYTKHINQDIKERVLIQCIDREFYFYKDLEKFALFIDVCSSKTKEELKKYKTSLEELEFVYNYRNGLIIKNLKEIGLEDIERAKFENSFNRDKYNRINSKPIFLIDFIGLNSFYEQKKREISYLNGVKQTNLYKYCIELTHQTSFKHINNIEFSFDVSKEGKLTYKTIENISSIQNSNLVKIPSKQWVILYIQNTKNLIELINPDISENKQFDISEHYKSYDLILTKPKYLDMSNFRATDKYNSNCKNLITEFYRANKTKDLEQNFISRDNNKYKFISLFKGFNSSKLHTLANKRVYTKKGSLKNIQNNPSKVEYNNYLINLYYRRDKKAYFPKIQKNLRVIPINKATNLILEQQKQYKTFIQFFHSWIQDYTVISGLIEFKNYNNSKLEEYLSNNLKVNEYLLYIFLNCYFPIDIEQTTKINLNYSSSKEKWVNKQISNNLYQMNKKPIERVKRIVYRDLNQRDYIKSELYNSEKYLIKLFEIIGEIDFFNPLPDINPNFNFLGKKYHLGLILDFYNKKITQYKVALKLGILSKYQYNKLRNRLRFIIWYYKQIYF